MKVGSANGVGSAQGSRGTARASGGGFSVGASGAAQETAPSAKVAGVAGVGSIDALLALQSVGTPLERRRRAVGRAGRILDVLDQMKVSLLEGGLSTDSLSHLVGAVREERDRTDDPRLEGVLDEIETRAAVELAKLGMAA
jgi:hypothetical protein